MIEMTPIRFVAVTNLLVILAVSGCGDDESCPSGTSAVLLERSGGAGFFFQDGNGPWTQFPLGASGRVCARRDFKVSVSCYDSAGRPNVDEYRGTVADGERQQVYTSCGDARGVESRFSVGGSMKQPGFVTIGDVGLGSSAESWQFSDLRLPRGTYDLVASDYDYAPLGEARVAVQRDILLAGPTTLENIDLDENGTHLVPIDINVIGLRADDTPSTEIRLRTKNSTLATISSHPGLRAYVSPPGGVGSEDTELLTLRTRSESFVRVAEGPIEAAGPGIELLPVFEGVSFEETPLVTWDSLPTAFYTELSFIVYGDGGAHNVRASSNWLSDNDANHLDVSADVLDDELLSIAPLRYRGLSMTLDNDRLRLSTEATLTTN